MVHKFNNYSNSKTVAQNYKLREEEPGRYLKTSEETF
jgi:hypothetical protein